MKIILNETEKSIKWLRLVLLPLEVLRAMRLPRAVRTRRACRKRLAGFLTDAFVFLAADCFVLFLCVPHPIEVRADASQRFSPLFPSIAFYIIVSAYMAPTPILGRFWEWQLPNGSDRYSLTYVSEAPFSVDGRSCVVPLDCSVRDRFLCSRTAQTIRHFVALNSDKRWYFRGVHDTYINVPALADFILDLEQRFDPMAECVLAYNVHVRGRLYFPHGGAGWLTSRFAIGRFHQNLKTFQAICRGVEGDDVAMGQFLARLGINVLKWQTDRWIVAWPSRAADIITAWTGGAPRLCPKGYRLKTNGTEFRPASIKRAAVIHWHGLPLELAHIWLPRVPDDYALTFPRSWKPSFCRFNLSA
jgi:hypothetical protein